MKFSLICKKIKICRHEIFLFFFFHKSIVDRSTGQPWPERTKPRPGWPTTLPWCWASTEIGRLGAGSPRRRLGHRLWGLRRDYISLAARDIVRLPDGFPPLGQSIFVSFFAVFRLIRWFLLFFPFYSFIYFIFFNGFLYFSVFLVFAPDFLFLSHFPMVFLLSLIFFAFLFLSRFQCFFSHFFLFFFVSYLVFFVSILLHRLSSVFIFLLDLLLFFLDIQHFLVYIINIFYKNL